MVIVVILFRLCDILLSKGAKERMSLIEVEGMLAFNSNQSRAVYSILSVPKKKKQTLDFRIQRLTSYLKKL